jgi:hypothetical protein
MDATNDDDGEIVFATLAEALRAGWHVVDRTVYGYTLRRRTTKRGWEKAVWIKEHDTKGEHDSESRG